MEGLLAAVDRTGATPLHWAGSPAVANALLVAGAAVDAPDSAGLSPLHYAAASSDHGSSAESVGVLLAGGAAVDSADGLGRTPLSHAAAEGSFAAVVALLAGGADANLADSNRWLPLVHAAARGRVEVALALLDDGGSALPMLLWASTGGLAGGGDAAVAATAHGHAALGRCLALVSGQTRSVPDSASRTLPAVAPTVPRLRARTVWAALQRLERGGVAVAADGEAVWRFVLAQRHALCAVLLRRRRRRAVEVAGVVCHAAALDRHLIESVLRFV